MVFAEAHAVRLAHCQASSPIPAYAMIAPGARLGRIEIAHRKSRCKVPRQTSMLRALPGPRPAWNTRLGLSPATTRPIEAMYQSFGHALSRTSRESRAPSTHSPSKWRPLFCFFRAPPYRTWRVAIETLECSTERGFGLIADLFRQISQ